MIDKIRILRVVLYILCHLCLLSTGIGVLLTIRVTEMKLPKNDNTKHISGPIQSWYFSKQLKSTFVNLSTTTSLPVNTKQSKKNKLDDNENNYLAINLYIFVACVIVVKATIVYFCCYYWHTILGAVVRNED